MDELASPYDLTQLSVFQNAPESSGIYILFDKNGEVVMMGWADNLSQQINKHLPSNERDFGLKALARKFKFYVTNDPAMYVQLFDNYVERHGAPPKCQKEIPEKSRYARVRNERDGPVSPDESGRAANLRQLAGKGEAGVKELGELARIEYKKGNADRALEYLDRIHELGGESATSHLARGMVLLLRGRQAAIEEWRRAARLDPGGKVGKKAEELMAYHLRKIVDGA